MNFLKRMFKPKEQEVRSWQGITAGQMLYGNSPVTPTNAESLSAVLACVQAISSAISALPVLVHQSQGKTRVEVDYGAIPTLVRYGPNPYQTWPEFIEMLVSQILAHGNGLVEIMSDRSGNTNGLCVIPWNWCNPVVLPNGKIAYEVYDQPGIWALGQGKRRRLLQHEVIHIRDRSDDGLIGVSRLRRAAFVIRNAQTVNDFAAAAFRNGFFPSGVVQTDAILTQAQREQMNDSFVKSFSGTQNAARALILDQGLQWSSLTAISPEDAELLASRKFSVIEICRIFGVPPPLIQDYSNNTFTNSDAAGRWFAQFCLLPLVRKLEAAFNRGLFEDSDYELSFDMSSFDRGDSENRWKSHAIAAKHGILTPDEIREIEGWEPRG